MTLLLTQPAGTSVPRPGRRSAAYWEGCRQHRLLFQECAACSYRGLGSVSVSALCHATTPVWKESAGHGSLYSWTVVWRPPDPSFRVPYAAAVVLLDEGVWMMSAVIGCEPEELDEGIRLSGEFQAASDAIA